MEELLRNLSKNIENNTGENAYKPEDRPPEEDDDHGPIEITISDSEEDSEEKMVEERDEDAEDTDSNEPEEDNPETEDYDSEADYKEPEDIERNEENADEHEEDDSEEEHAEEINEEPDEEHAESDEDHKETDEEDVENEAYEEHEEDEEEPNDEPETHEAKAAILTMNEEEADSGKHEKRRTRKYSPEVETALDRLNSEETQVEFSEPLSTEPKEKRNGGRIIVAILLIFAVFAIILCVLVEQNLIDNPFLLFSKEPETSKTDTGSQTSDVSEDETKLSDRTTISAIDRLFKQIHSDGNFFIYDRTSQTIDGTSYVYYYVAEPDEEYTSKLTNCGEAEAETNCVDSVEIVNNKNYDSFPHYRYTFEKMDSGSYEFYKKEKIESTQTIEDELKEIDGKDKE